MGSAMQRAGKVASTIVLGAIVGGYGFSLAKLAIFRVGWGGEFAFDGGAWNASIAAMLIDGAMLSFAYLLVLALVSPFWTILQRSVLRHWWAASGLGAGLTALVWVAVIAVHHWRGPYYMAASSFALLVGAMIAANAVAGLAIFLASRHRISPAVRTSAFG